MRRRQIYALQAAAAEDRAKAEPAPSAPEVPEPLPKVAKRGRPAGSKNKSRS
jgi:hypothetical protein